jgi:hypothetical protein
MTSAQLATDILIRMRDIDDDIDYVNDIPTCHDYSLLWDAILDEIKHFCPEIDVDKALKYE